jgi:serine/threonine protein kinase
MACTDSCFSWSAPATLICDRCRADRRPVEALPRGAVVGGVYEVGRILGRGGFAVTYLGRDRKLGSLVAIKEFLPERLAIRRSDGTVSAASSDDDSRFRETLLRFVDEARRVAALHHDGVVKVIRLEEEKGTAYLVMPYIAGETLQSRHARRVAEQRPWTVPELLTMLQSVIHALDYVHGLRPPLLHRDLKPDNVFLTTVGDQQRAFLLDFGAARQVLQSTAGGHRPTQIWTPGFAPIEQEEQAVGTQSAATDVYALAATFYYLLADRLPASSSQRLIAERQGPDPVLPLSALRKDLPPRASDIIMRGMALWPQQRYSTVREFTTALKAALDSGGGGSGGGGSGGGGSDGFRRLRPFLVAAGLATSAWFLWNASWPGNVDPPPPPKVVVSSPSSADSVWLVPPALIARTVIDSTRCATVTSAADGLNIQSREGARCVLMINQSGAGDTLAFSDSAIGIESKVVRTTDVFEAVSLFSTEYVFVLRCSASGNSCRLRSSEFRDGRWEDWADGPAKSVNLQGGFRPAFQLLATPRTVIAMWGGEVQLVQRLRRPAQVLWQASVSASGRATIASVRTWRIRAGALIDASATDSQRAGPTRRVADSSRSTPLADRDLDGARRELALAASTRARGEYLVAAGHTDRAMTLAREIGAKRPAARRSADGVTSQAMRLRAEITSACRAELGLTVTQCP